MTVREQVLLDALTRRCRVLTLAQVGQLACGTATERARWRAARELVLRLVDDGLLTIVHALARPPLPLTLPLVVWNPGDPEPNYDAVSYLLKSRWTEPPRRLTCVVASPAALSLFGSRTRPLSQALQISHDLGVGQAYLRFRELEPELSEHWLGEDAFRPWPSRGRRIPDAALRGPDGSLFLAIEFGGAYEPERLRGLLQAALHDSIPLQVW